MSTTSQQFQRERNLALVMNALRELGAGSRSELATALHLDRSTLTHLSNELLAAGLIIETDERPASARGGRRARPLTLNPDRYAVLGVDVQAGDASWALLRLDGTVRENGEIQRREADGLQWLQSAATASLGAVSDARNGGSLALLGVGVSIPGVVDNRSGMVLRSVALGLESILVQSYWKSPGAPIFVDNDANCCAWNLATDPLAPQNIVVSRIKLHQSQDGRFRPSGAGIGLAFILNGSIYYGSRGASGELRGVSWTQSTPDQLGLRLREIQDGSGTTQALRALAAETLRNLGVVVSALDPDCLVIAGDLSALSGPIGDLLVGELAGSPVAALAREGALKISSADEYPAAHGAARMALARYFGGSIGDGRLPILRHAPEELPLAEIIHGG